MRAAHRSALHAALGAAAALAGLTAGRCSGGSCGSCLACAVPGASVLLLALASSRGTEAQTRPRAPVDSSGGARLR